MHKMRNTPFVINFTTSCVYCPERNHFTWKPVCSVMVCGNWNTCHAEWRHIRWRCGSGSLWRHNFFPVATLYQRKVRRSHVKKLGSHKCEEDQKVEIFITWKVNDTRHSLLSKCNRYARTMTRCVSPLCNKSVG
jgi:hypothetical protein